MPTWFTGKGYGISNITDVTGRPLLTYQGPEDKAPFLLADRVAQTFDFTIRQTLKAGAMRNDRMDSGVAAKAKKILGGGSNDELDHKISLELGGANTPANLWIQSGINNGPSAASDTLENNLALDVVNSKISLLEAWRILEEQKGFLLAEDMTGPQKGNFLRDFLALSGNLRDYISGKNRINSAKPDAGLKAQMDKLLVEMRTDPLNQVKATAMFQAQVDSVHKQLGGTVQEAQKTTKSLLAAYAQSKGIDPREMIAATNANIQKIIDNSKRDPNIFGIPSVTIIKIIGVLQAASTGLVLVGIVLAIIGIALAGPEVVFGALAGGLLESIGAIFGVSLLTGLGLTAFAVGEALNVANIGLNMTVKSMYDNGYLIPNQNITSLKDALAIQKGLTGFLPSEATGAATVKPKAVKTVKAAPVYVHYSIVAPNGKTYVFPNAQALQTFKNKFNLK